MIEEENKDNLLNSVLSDFEDKEDTDKNKDVANRKSGLRLGQGNLAENANPDTNNSKTDGSIDIDTPASSLILIEYNETKECDADKDKNYKNDKKNKNINKNRSPIKKRKRDTILSR